MLNYYRSMAWRTLLAGMHEAPRPIHMPTLMLWGTNDPALDLANIEREPLLRWVPDLRIQTLDTGHFVHIDAPEEVSARLSAFFGGSI
jgi:pimeloyl-ACP methyl ester carboxylesterase